MPKLIDRVLAKVSQTVLTSELGVSRGLIHKAREGTLPRSEQTALNRRLREYQQDVTYQTAQLMGRRATARNVQLEEPLKPHRLVTPKAVKPEYEDRVTAIKKEFPRLSKNTIQGLLERDQYTREKLAEALTSYREAKAKAIHDYTARHVKRMSLEEYIQSKTGKEYKVLSKAFDQRKKTENQRDMAKLLRSGNVDLTVENYGRGRGQWHSLKHL